MGGSLFRGCGDTLKADGSSHHFDKLVHNILIGLNDGTYPGERMVPEQMKWFYGELVKHARNSGPRGCGNY
jgi:hypothetical protein